ncbi:hypothetical protein I3760_06G055900 [Carya illinoinensis]|nr:hypothetical protein I3760_06G055900 [Carya illinoinensis]
MPKPSFLCRSKRHLCFVALSSSLSCTLFSLSLLCRNPSLLCRSSIVLILVPSFSSTDLQRIPNQWILVAIGEI